jgi:hypothetical protein
VYRLQFGGSDANGSVSGIKVVEYFIFIVYLASRQWLTLRRAKLEED